MYISTKLNCAKQTDGNNMDMSGFHGENEGENRIESLLKSFVRTHVLHISTYHMGNVLASYFFKVTNDAF